MPDPIPAAVRPTNPDGPITLHPADAAWLIVLVQSSRPAEGEPVWGEDTLRHAYDLLQHGTADTEAADADLATALSRIAALDSMLREYVHGWLCRGCGWRAGPDGIDVALWPAARADGSPVVEMVCPQCGVAGEFVDWDVRTELREARADLAEIHGLVHDYNRGQRKAFSTGGPWPVPWSALSSTSTSAVRRPAGRCPMADTLFDWEQTPTPTLSADRRRTLRQRGRLDTGAHPLSAVVPRGLALHAQAAPADDRRADGRRCGSCRFRTLVVHNNGTYPKCTHTVDGGTTYPRVSRGAATDVRTWWPACVDHEYGDPKLSPDAARSGPASAVEASDG